MAARPLYTLHPAPLTVLFGDLENQAAALQQVLLGTPGSLLQRSNAAGFLYYVRQFYDATGKKRDQYLAGPVGDPAADQVAADMQVRMAEARATAKDIALLAREGYQLADARTLATLASLHNVGLFRAGAVLVGSHALGVLLNQLGVRAAAYATEDIDIARHATLQLPQPLTTSFVEILNTSGLPFVEVPGLDVRQPSSSWKERGRSRFHVDLLVPAEGDEIAIAPVPELQAHAQAVPYLRYLLVETQPGALIAREGLCHVRVPLPERFAVHKLLVAQLRSGRSAKADKDLAQAACLFAVLAERRAGAIEDALAALPASAVRHVKRGIADVVPRLLAAHPRAAEALLAFGGESP